jgi:SAM-dependent methyltransferase
MPVFEALDTVAFHNPTKEIQERAVGGSFEATYGEAANFLNYVLQHTFQPKLPSRVLDFGCGWGRMLRLLRRLPALKNVELHGCDVNIYNLDNVRRSVPFTWLAPCDFFPPTRYNAGTFDLIYAYSVFSHLSEDSHLAWAADYARMLKPGGFVCLTTQGLKLLDMCKAYRDGSKPITHIWHEYLARSFAEPDCADRFNRGEFLYSATSPDNPTYGEAMVPRQYFEKTWGALGFEMLDWDETYGQNRTVMRLRG